ncbi:DUF2065 domain-containing protein [Roseibium suaedae]|uniref:DUF2065 domain-containing protein n=1 Tax=Roseibium suaedae TaxID=735517 RepID=A0A1M7GXI7_9HYPH|nr:DUF2065 domain-containing protein [Roseibium suaedae]SHM20846.1 hypothetical protein SAMN05444272_2047 [Roseibium suaedae]
MKDLIIAVAMALALEGTLYALNPGGMKQVMRSALETPDRILRIAGLGALVLGVLIVWLVRG